MAEDIKFNMVITDEALSYARQAKVNPGWYLIPKKFGVSSSQGTLDKTRLTASMSSTWYNGPFSGVYGSGNSSLINSVVIPPNAYPLEVAVGEIYFIYETPSGEEFLYAIAQPQKSLNYTPGVSQDYVFLFTINNTNVADTYVIEYTFPQDIEDHNHDGEAHDYLLARNGRRTATGILKYEEPFTFTDNLDIPNKQYIDAAIANAVSTGFMTFWPSTTCPTGWLIRDGRAISRITYANLFKVIGTTYGTGDGSTTFNLPDDRGLFMRGWDNLRGIDLNRQFGSQQSSASPNITGTFGALCRGGDTQWTNTGTGAFYKYYNGPGWGPEQNGSAQYDLGYFDASRSWNGYSNVNEVRVSNRAYLPIIKF